MFRIRRLVARSSSRLIFGVRDMRPELTVFQIEVEKGMNDVLEHLGKHVDGRRIAGIRHVRLGLPTSDVGIYRLNVSLIFENTTKRSNSLIKPSSNSSER